MADLHYWSKGRAMKPILLLAASLVLAAAAGTASPTGYPDPRWAEAPGATSIGGSAYQGDYRQESYGQGSYGQGNYGQGTYGQGSYEDAGLAPDHGRSTPYSYPGDLRGPGFADRNGQPPLDAPYPRADQSRDGAWESGAMWPPRAGGAGEPRIDGYGDYWRSEARPDSRDAARPYQEYRFRGDPPAGSDRWGGREDVGGYRFRPLTDQETDRRTQTPGWRPLSPSAVGSSRSDSGSLTSGPSYPGRSYPERSDPSDREHMTRPAGRSGLMDALTPPPRTYGFEANPWP
jgi:hypothetical protein